MTFLKYTQKGLLKNVQDGISRPLGSRENTESKGEVFFTNPLDLIKLILMKLGFPKLLFIKRFVSQGSLNYFSE